MRTRLASLLGLLSASGCAASPTPPVKGPVAELEPSKPVSYLQGAIEHDALGWVALPDGDVVVVDGASPRPLQLKRLHPDGRSRWVVAPPVPGDSYELRAIGNYLVVLARRESSAAVVTLDARTGAPLSQVFTLERGISVLASNGVVFTSNGSPTVDVLHPMGGLLARVRVETPSANHRMESEVVHLGLQPDDSVLAVTRDGGVYAIDQQGKRRGYSPVDETVMSAIARPGGGLWVAGRRAVYGLTAGATRDTVWRLPRGEAKRLSLENGVVVVENDSSDVYEVDARSPTSAQARLTFESSDGGMRFERIRAWERGSPGSLVISDNGDKLYAVRGVERYDEVDLASVKTSPFAAKVTTHTLKAQYDEDYLVTPTAVFFDGGVKLVAGAGHWNYGGPAELSNVVVFDLAAQSPKRLEQLMPKPPFYAFVGPEWATATGPNTLYVCLTDICYEHTDGREAEPPRAPRTGIFGAPGHVVALQANPHESRLIAATLAQIYERTETGWSSLKYPGPSSIGRLTSGSALWALTGFRSDSDAVLLDQAQDQHLYKLENDTWSVVETPTTNITTLCDDRHKTLWVGSPSGLARLDKDTWRHVEGVGEEVSSIVSVDGKLWVAAADGLYLGVPTSATVPPRDLILHAEVEAPILAAAATQLSVAPATLRLAPLGPIPLQGKDSQVAALSVASEGSTLYLADASRVIAWPETGPATTLFESVPWRTSIPFAVSDQGLITTDNAVRLVATKEPGLGQRVQTALGVLRALGAAPGGAIWVASTPTQGHATIHQILGGLDSPPMPSQFDAETRSHHVDAPPFLYADVEAVSAKEAWFAGGAASFRHADATDTEEMPIGAGALVHYDGARYRTWRFREGALLAMTRLSNGEVWAVGVGGLVVRLHGDEVEAGVLPRAPTLRAVFEHAGELWIAGDDDTLVVGRDMSSLARVDTSVAGIRTTFTGVARRAGDTLVIGPAGFFKVVR
ncbi:MAG: hypothetical protein U0271_02695 [Polyangiaceae bacterium]